MSKIVVYTRGWTLSAPIEGEEEPTSMLGVRVVVDGCEVKDVLKVEVAFKHDEFVSPSIHVHASTFDVVPLTQEQFRAEELPAP